MARFPDPDSFPFRSWTYPQGFMLWGMIRLYERTGDTVYLDYVRKYGDEHVSGDGSVSGWDGGSMDDMMPGSVLAWLYHATGEEKYRLACRRIYASFADYPRNPDGGFWHGRGMKGQMWVDGVFMAEPVSNVIGGLACYIAMYLTVLRKLPEDGETAYI